MSARQRPTYSLVTHPPACVCLQRTASLRTTALSHEETIAMAIKECCNTGAVRCTQDTLLSEVAGLMRHHTHRRMPIVTAACALDGGVTPDDDRPTSFRWNSR